MTRAYQNYDIFVSQLVAMRIARGFTQRKLADAANVDQCFVARTETRKRRLDLAEAVHLLKAMKVPRGEILKIMGTLI